jgi:hypothetical protein
LAANSGYALPSRYRREEGAIITPSSLRTKLLVKLGSQFSQRIVGGLAPDIGHHDEAKILPWPEHSHCEIHSVGSRMSNGRRRRPTFLNRPPPERVTSGLRCAGSRPVPYAGRNEGARYGDSIPIPI